MNSKAVDQNIQGKDSFPPRSVHSSTFQKFFHKLSHGDCRSFRVTCNCGGGDSGHVYTGPWEV